MEVTSDSVVAPAPDKHLGRVLLLGYLAVAGLVVGLALLLNARLHHAALEDAHATLGARSGKEAQALQRRLDELKTLSAEFTSVWLFDSEGRPRLGAAGSPPHAHPIDAASLQQALASQRPVLLGLHAEPGHNGATARIDVAAPLLAGEADAARLAGFVVFEIDPARYLFPLIQHWPIATETAESLLLRIEGGAVVHLTPMRHAAAAAPPMHMPLATAAPELLAVQAASGRVGPVTGVDYRGQRVIGWVNPVEKLGWILLAKIDEREAYAEADRIGYWIAGSATVLLTVLALLLSATRRRLQAQQATEVLQAELDRRRQEKVLDFIFHNAGEIMLLTDEAGNLLEVNEAAVQAYGYEREALLRLNLLDLRAPQTLADLPDHLDRLDGTEAFSFATQHRRSDGSVFPVEVSTQMFQHEGRGYRQSIIRDVSERRAFEHALETSEQRLRTILDSVGEAVFIQPIDGVAIFSVNRSACEMFGLSAEEFAGIDVTALSASRRADIAAAGQEFIRLAAGGEPQTFEWRARHASGRLFFTEVSLCRARIGDSDRLLAVVRDIDQRKLADQALKNNLAHLTQLNRRMEEAQNQLLQSEKMASIGQLAAGVAHEINNPIGFVHSNLGTLQGYVGDMVEIIAACERVHVGGEGALAAADPVRQLQREKDYEYMRTDVFQLLAESRDGLARVRKIVEDLRGFSRVGESDWQWADLHQGLDSTLNIVANELKYKCTVRKEYGALPRVYCLVSQLNQVFMNLLVNAGHAIETQGEIAIRTGVEGDSVWVEVADTGQGIPRENLKRIFEPFYTTKPVGKGTGLGLSLSYSIVQRHQGRIEVASEVGRGTCFRVILPLRPVTAGQGDTGSKADSAVDEGDRAG